MFGLAAVSSNVAYSAVKGGEVNLNRSAGIAYAGQGIQVNCVCPEVINAPLVSGAEKRNYRKLPPMHRSGEDLEIVSIITFCAVTTPGLLSARLFLWMAAIPVCDRYMTSMRKSFGLDQSGNFQESRYGLGEVFPADEGRKSARRPAA